jgi:WD40 repeat protein
MSLSPLGDRDPVETEDVYEGDEAAGAQAAEMWGKIISDPLLTKLLESDVGALSNEWWVENGRIVLPASERQFPSSNPPKITTDVVRIRGLISNNRPSTAVNGKAGRGPRHRTRIKRPARTKRAPADQQYRRARRHSEGRRLRDRSPVIIDKTGPVALAWPPRQSWQLAASLVFVFVTFVATVFAASKPHITISREPVFVAKVSDTGPVSAVAFSSYGVRLASPTYTLGMTTVRVWDVAEQSLAASLVLPDAHNVEAIAFSPDGARLASANSEGLVMVWDLGAHQSPGERLNISTGPVMSMALSSDGTTLATAGVDHGVRLSHLALASPKVLAQQSLTGHTGWVTSMAFSPDGTELATAMDQTVRLWDVASRQPLGEPFTSYNDAVLSVAFSPDGATLATASADATVRLWDVATRQSIAQINARHTDPVLGVAFSPDGSRLASASSDGTVRIWEVHRAASRGPPNRGAVKDSVNSPRRRNCRADAGCDRCTGPIWRYE